MVFEWITSCFYNKSKEKNVSNYILYVTIFHESSHNIVATTCLKLLRRATMTVNFCHFQFRSESLSSRRCKRGLPPYASPQVCPPCTSFPQSYDSWNSARDQKARWSGTQHGLIFQPAPAAPVWSREMIPGDLWSVRNLQHYQSPKCRCRVVGPPLQSAD